jgi:N-acetylneuraminic acid mutarotase/aspartokinase-like uncharacterized kinase
MKKLFTLFLLINSAVFFGQWTASTVIPANRTQHGLVAHPNGNLYLFNGYTGSGGEVNTLFIYNIATNSWTTGANSPFSTRGVAYCLGTDNMIYLQGGAPNTNSFVRYDVATNTWSTLASCPTGAWEGSMTSEAGKIYYAGGEPYESLMRIYDIAANTWTTAANLPTGVKEHKIVRGNNGYLYVFGGVNAGYTPVNPIQRYDMAANTWSVIGTIPVQKNQFGACLAPDGRIYLVCGKNNGSNNAGPFFSDVNVFNPCSNTWTVSFSHPIAHGELAVASTTNGIFAMGGTTGTGINANYFLPVTPGSLTYPNIAFTPASLAVCAGSSATLGVTGASTYTWSTGSNSTSIVITPSVNTTYTVTGTSVSGCVSPTAAVSIVTVNALPTLSATSNSSLICVGQSATLTAAGANTYTWSTTSNSTSIVVSPTASATYTLNGTNANGCSNVTTITQSVSLCTGIVSSSLKEIAVGLYPNPTNGVLNIALSSLSENVNVELYNNMGQLILSQKVIALNSDLNLENAANGIYSIRITENGKAVFTSKIVKQ